MREESFKICQFSELSESVQEKVVENNYDINVCHDWWEWTYEDADRVGIKIEGFNLCSSRGTDIKFEYGAKDAAESILKEHGKDCGTFKAATEYLAEREGLFSNFEAKVRAEIADCRQKLLTDLFPEDIREELEERIEELENSLEDVEYEIEDELEELDREFRKSLEYEYNKMLQAEYDYLTSKEAIIETIESNEYEYFEDGTRY